MSGKAASRNTVAEYISGIDSGQREIVEALRRLVLKEAPTATEAVKWRQPCYSKNSNICYIAADVGHVKLGFFSGGDLFDPESLLEGTGKKMRHIKVPDLDDVREKAFSSLIREALDLDERRR